MRYLFLLCAILITGCSGTTYVTSTDLDSGNTLTIETTKTAPELYVATENTVILRKDVEQLTVRNVQGKVRGYVPSINRQRAITRTWNIDQDTSKTLRVPGQSGNYILLSAFAGAGAGLLPFLLIGL